VRRLRGRFVRAEMAASGDTLARSVREASARKIPNVVVVGRREQAEGTVTLRTLGFDRQVTLPVDAFERHLLLAIEQRRRGFVGPETA
jgi:threonyl-tRNA synthetase